MQNPALHGVDARHDLQSIRAMIDAGSGYPPHWRGDAGDISLATAQAMQGPTERHLRRRQAYFLWMLQDILYHAYSRAAQAGKARPLPKSAARAGAKLYEALFTVDIPDLSRYDNEALARAAQSASQTFAALAPLLRDLPPALAREALRITFKFIGEPAGGRLIEQVMGEVGAKV